YADLFHGNAVLYALQLWRRNSEGGGGYQASADVSGGFRDGERGAGSGACHRCSAGRGRRGYRYRGFADDLLYSGHQMSVQNREQLSAAFFQTGDQKRLSETYLSGGNTGGYPEHGY